MGQLHQKELKSATLLRICPMVYLFSGDYSLCQSITPSTSDTFEIYHRVT